MSLTKEDERVGEGVILICVPPPLLSIILSTIFGPRMKRKVGERLTGNREDEIYCKLLERKLRKNEQNEQNFTQLFVI